MADFVTYRGDDKSVIFVRGRFIFSDYREFISIVQTIQNQIVLDLAEVDYLDSSALGMLLMARDQVKGREIHIRNATDRVKRIFEIVRFEKFFKLE